MTEPTLYHHPRLTHLATLAYGWDSYGAAPIAANALRSADALAFCPTSHGGIMVELHAGGMDIEIFIEPDGQVSEFNALVKRTEAIG